MNNLSEWEKEEKLKQKRCLEDIDICIRLLETLKEDYIAPGYSTKINASKVTRTRLMIHDLLKNY